MTRADPLKPNPRAAAEQIVAAHKNEQAWLDEFAQHLDKHRSGQALAGILSVWDLSQAETARLLGLSRQAVSKWLERGAPAERAELVSDLAAATDLLVRYLKRDRIPAVVRRPIAARNGVSLLNLLASDRSDEVLSSCREMFEFDRSYR